MQQPLPICCFNSDGQGCPQPAVKGTVVAIGTWMFSLWLCEEHAQAFEAVIPKGGQGPQHQFMMGPVQWQGFTPLGDYLARLRGEEPRPRTKPFCEICGGEHWTAHHQGN